MENSGIGLLPVNTILHSFLQKEENQQKSFKEDIRQLLTEIQQKGIDKPFLDVSEACSFLSISKSTLYKLNHRKVLPYYKMGKKVMYDKNDLIKHITKTKILSNDDVDIGVERFMKKYRPKY